MILITFSQAKDYYAKIGKVWKWVICFMVLQQQANPP